ncbi:MAG TPA: DsbA family oxidoreductase [Xanthomonadaceae bacterium]|nr:DsbA family oxidoreductase [Xanthomonadaceae bacterium]
MAGPLRIDFVSDVSCPWCAVGLASLQQALARVPELEVELHFQPFELNPQLGPGGEDAIGHLTRKYGMSEAQARANGEVIRQRGAEYGFTFDLDRRERVYNTFDAHRLLHWAGLEGADRQLALKQRLLRAYFAAGEDVSDHAVLARLAADAGLDDERARAILASDAYAEDVRLHEQFFAAHGIQAVPSVILDRRLLVQGGQPPEVFEQALRHAAETRTG